jgi:agmatinase
MNAFLGQQHDYAKAKVVFLPVPYEGTVSYGKGTSKGPQAIIDSSPQLEFRDEELGCEQHEQGFHTLPAMKPMKKPADVVEHVYQETKKQIANGKFLVLLGGEHSITTGEVKAYIEKFPDLSILQIDAHADLRDEWEEDRNSHACAMRRAYDHTSKIVQVGIRNISPEEIEFVKEKKHDGVFYAHEIRKDSKWISKAVSKLSDNVFITIDVDGFDSSIMPATGTPEPGGLDWYQVTDLLREISRKKNIVGFDIVELAPIAGLHHCDFTAAKLAYRLIGYKFCKT